MSAPRPDLLLHVGMEKTGSTSIQAFLEANRPALAARGVLYPDGLGRPARPMVALSVPHARATGDWGGVRPEERPHLEAAFDGLFADAASFARAMDAVASGGARRVVLSSEVLWPALAGGGPGARAIGADLRRRFGAITVVAVLRRPDRHLASLHAQGAKAGHPVDVDAALRSPPPAHRFADALRRIGALLGARIVAIPFERARLPGGDVVAAFRDAAGWTAEGLAMPPRAENPSLDAAHVEAMLRLAAAEGPEAAAAVRDALLARPMPGAPWRLGDREARAYLARLGGQMRRAAAIAGLRGPLFAEAPPMGDRPRGGADRAAIAAAEARIAALRELANHRPRAT